MISLKGTRVTWLGHATVLVQTPKGTNILIDPFLQNNPKYPKSFELPGTINYILLTHGHGDHISDAVPVAKKHKSNVAAIYELAAYIASQGADKITGFNIGGTVQLDDVAVTMVEAKHSAGAEGKNGAQYAGVATGFVLTIANGPVLYHAGDTTVFTDMKLIKELYHPELAMLPIGGFYTMGPREAALAAQFIEPKAILPIHFGTFPPLTGTPDELDKYLNGSIEVIRVAPGESIQ
ncbi:metal-dependent hydrolase [Occallatibacter savannae]|uniref:metal-dependent hydrolase n=1 Tax=Occallatibacter savannae TaxID=1002691 RepID=UPI000D6862C8|nr:metal-dependent hydrolase [Occallatibacter savannae]